MELIWNVYISDFNSKEIKVHNVFNHAGFMQDLIKIKKECKDNIEAFEARVERSLTYYYWSKCEWETIVTSWPPYITNKELDDIIKERDEASMKYGMRFRHCVCLETAEKIDVYDQVRMNWRHFINYLWDNRKLIKNKRKNHAAL